MFGEGGWCRSCGVPRRAQCGNLVLRRKGLKSIRGAWTPNWRFDIICLERELADRVAARFRVELRDVDWHGHPVGAAQQIVVPPVGEAWFDHEQLRDRVAADHGVAGARCDDCGAWRWLPLAFEVLPPLRTHKLPPLLDIPGLNDLDVAASPEWFGDGWQAFRQVLVRRELAQMLVEASPRDFTIQEVT